MSATLAAHERPWGLSTFEAYRERNKDALGWRETDRWGYPLIDPEACECDGITVCDDCKVRAFDERHAAC